MNPKSMFAQIEQENHTSRNMDWTFQSISAPPLPIRSWQCITVGEGASKSMQAHSLLSNPFPCGTGADKFEEIETRNSSKALVNVENIVGTFSFKSVEFLQHLCKSWTARIHRYCCNS
jgi:hypothetical protein